ncbi:hypothetical protein PGT21_015589 [Puccinia graminis f. sp. tritici]|uniref:Uncharacterized protein n=1 Tax=Puccinia graminis f. sp. tritici TaxID=56615 RepID=A0A5B0R0P3_PUCGR|nr:hypothetical protein PGT21_015589 [Puccinia graminis f. sp. tritici]
MTNDSERLIGDGPTRARFRSTIDWYLWSLLDWMAIGGFDLIDDCYAIPASAHKIRFADFAVKFGLRSDSESESSRTAGILQPLLSPSSCQGTPEGGSGDACR